MSLAAEKVETLGGEILREDLGFGEPRRCGRGGCESGVIEIFKVLLRGAEGVRLQLAWLGGRGVLSEHKLQPHADGVQVVGLSGKDFGDDFLLERLGEVAEVDHLVLGEILPSCFEVGFFERGVVLGVVRNKSHAEAVAKCLLVELVEGDGNAVVKASGADLVCAKVFCDFGKVATNEGLAVEERFEECEAKAFSDGGGDEVGGVGEPALIMAGRSFDGWGVIGDVEKNRELVFLGKVLPMLIDGLPFGIHGGQGHREAGVGRGERGKEDQLAKIFAPNTANGVEDSFFSAGRRRSGVARVSNDRVG